MIKKITKINIKDSGIRQNIVENLHVSHLTKSEQDKIIFMLMDGVSSRINATVWEKLLQEDRKELKKLSKKETIDYIATKIENFPKLVENITKQTINEFKQKRASKS